MKTAPLSLSCRRRAASRLDTPATASSEYTLPVIASLGVTSAGATIAPTPTVSVASSRELPNASPKAIPGAPRASAVRSTTSSGAEVPTEAPKGFDGDGRAKADDRERPEHHPRLDELALLLHGRRLVRDEPGRRPHDSQKPDCPGDDEDRPLPA